MCAACSEAGYNVRTLAQYMQCWLTAILIRSVWHPTKYGPKINALHGIPPRASYLHADLPQVVAWRHDPNEIPHDLLAASASRSMASKQATFSQMWSYRLKPKQNNQCFIGQCTYNEQHTDKLPTLLNCIFAWLCIRRMTAINYCTCSARYQIHFIEPNMFNSYNIFMQVLAMFILK